MLVKLPSLQSENINMYIYHVAIRTIYLRVVTKGFQQCHRATPLKWTIQILIAHDTELITANGLAIYIYIYEVYSIEKGHTQKDPSQSIWYIIIHISHVLRISGRGKSRLPAKSGGADGAAPRAEEKDQ